jgi:multiple sugar transport system substrate-binding protein
MKRFFLLLALSAFLLTACVEVTYLPLRTPTAKKPESTPTPAHTPTPTPIPPTPTPDLGAKPEALRDITVSLWHGLDGLQASLLAQMAAEFSLTNPWGITVEARGWGNLSGLEQAVDNGKKGEGLPELVLAMPEQGLAWDEESLLAPLDIYFSNSEIGFSPADLDDFPQGIWTQDEFTGRRLGVPLMRSTRLLFYNQTWARELGFGAPPQTTAEFRAQACAANATFRTDDDPSNDGFGGLILDGDPWTAYSWFKAFEGDVVTGDQFDFGHDGNQAALEFLVDLRAAGCAWLTTDITAYHHLAGRQALFISGNLSEIGPQATAWQTAETSDTWTVIAFPGTQPISLAYGPSLMLFERGPARQLAGWLFIRWMLSPENQARWVQESGFLPVRISATGLVPNTPAQWQSAAALLPNMQTYPQRADWRVARRVLGNGFYTLFVLGLDPQDVLAEMQKTVEQVTGP